VMVSAPFSIPYMLTDLGMDRFLVMTLITMVTPTLLSVAVAKRWGAMCDRRGARPVLLISLFFWATVPFWYYRAGFGPTYPTIVIPWVLGGACTAGYWVARSKVSAALATGRKTTYLAVYWVVQTSAMALGAFAGSMILRQFGVLGSFATSTVLRMLSVLPFAVIALPGGDSDS